jgi:hypothetical protein
LIYTLPKEAALLDEISARNDGAHSMTMRATTASDDLRRRAVGGERSAKGQDCKHGFALLT